MSDDLVSRLRDYRIWNHAHHRYDAVPVVQEAAQALTEARAEIERLRGELADTKDDFLRRHKDAVDRFERIAKLESELSTLRARVREVVGPFTRFDHATTSEQPDKCVIARGRVPSVLTLADFEAARQLMEEVK